MVSLLTQHNRQSFNNFINRDINRIISVKNPIRILKNYVDDEYRTKVLYYIGGKDGDKIKYTVPKDMKPLDCRLDGITYQGTLSVVIDVIVEHNGVLKEYTEERELVKVPTMLHSDYCNLSSLTSEELTSEGESAHEKGGYFIIKGGEKVILSQEDTGNNIIYTHIDSDSNLVASIGSQIDSNAPESLHLTYDIKTKIVSVTIPYFKGAIPLILLFRALGITKEKEILEIICGDLTTHISKEIIEFILPSIQNLNDVYTQEIALKVMSIGTNVSAALKSHWKENLFYLFNSRLLPHIKNDSDDYYKILLRKGKFLGYMTRILALTQLNLIPLTDRDSLVMKRVRLPGEILTDMFREFYEDYIKEVKFRTDGQIEHDTKQDKNSETILKDIVENISYLTNNGEFQKNISKSFMGKWGKVPNSPRNEGVVQSHLRHTFMESLSQLRRVHLHLSDGPNTMEQRRLHNSQWGYFCPVETPDGGKIGQLKHLAQTCTISEEYDDSKLIGWIKNNKNYISHEQKLQYHDKNIHDIFVNGDWIGRVKNVKVVVDNLKTKRRDLSDSDIHWSFSIAWQIKNSCISILTTGGRLMRPLKLNGAELKKDIDLLGCAPDLLIKNGCEYIDPNETDTIIIGWSDKDNCSHYEISKTAMLGISALTLPYIEYNPIARNLYATSHVRASVSVYASNYRYRMDQKASLLHYGQCPLVHTGVVNKLNNNQAPYGSNIIVAIAACSGYNQEDAIIINKSALERGLFTSSYLTTHSIREDISSLGKRRPGDICIVNPKNSKKDILNMKKYWDYSSLDEYGIVKPGTVITSSTVLIGAYMVDMMGEWVDNSVVAKNAHKGEVVDKVHLSKTTPRIAKVLTREVRIPIVGDKFASRAAQKATLGIIVPKEDMPYTKDGLTPDIIFNPHSFPSRMTIAYFLEMLSGQLGILTGRLVEVPNFNSVPEAHDLLMNTLKKNGGDPFSENKLYSGTSGQLVCADACVGPIFYQRLKQMVGDKMYARGADGPVDAITKQPLQGRARGGGLKSGEMERDALLSHGMSQFVKEMYWDKSDAYEMVIDKKTGKIVPHNPEANIIHNADTAQVQVPYAFKLFLQEIQSMGVSINIGV
tara:strand:+ start:777 stop:4097 length:3321 start_codon:yes stop_codon:yes gene_type:complete